MGARGDSKLPNMGTGNFSPLQEQYLLLTAELSLDP